MIFDRKVLELDAATEVATLSGRFRSLVLDVLKRRGVVVAVSGGVDSAVCLALAAEALGPQRVLALLLPERDSSGASLELGQAVAEQVGTPWLVEEIGGALDALGCYRRRDEAIRSVLPEYRPGQRHKLVLPQDILDHERLNFFSIVVQGDDGVEQRVRLPLKPYLEIVAATNMKQRMRKNLEYYHADRLNYAVVGTPNRLEYDQGFFVKNGDGAADVKPIAHLYKTQVYQLARYLKLPEAVCNARPTTDTYSLPQTQEEFYFCLPYEQMDLVLYAHDHGIPADQAAPALALTPEQVEWVYRDLEHKRRTTRYLHLSPLLIGEVPSVRRSLHEAMSE